jgi:molecular chaperone GrpE
MSCRAVTRRTSLLLLQSTAVRRSLTGGRALQQLAPAAASCRQPILDLFSPRWFSSETEKKETAENEAKETAEDEATAEIKEEQATMEESAEASSGSEEEDEVEQLRTQVKGLKDQLLRSLAEQENTRRIAQRDIESSRQFAIQSFAKSLLEVSDNLSMALQAVPEGKEDDSVLKTLCEGIEMTERGLIKAFEKNGLIKFGEPGEAFDPNKHQALYEYPDAEKEAGTVGQVMKAGFMLRSRVLRPAEVGVIKSA